MHLLPTRLISKRTNKGFLTAASTMIMMNDTCGHEREQANESHRSIQRAWLAPLWLQQQGGTEHTHQQDKYNTGKKTSDNTSLETNKTWMQMYKNHVISTSLRTIGSRSIPCEGILFGRKRLVAAVVYQQWSLRMAAILLSLSQSSSRRE